MDRGGRDVQGGPIRVRPDDLLLVVDVQNDFCPGGALAVPRGNEVVPAINRLTAVFRRVALTQDWHPPDHASFAPQHEGKQPFDAIAMPYGDQVLWPIHCVQGTKGAEFHHDLNTVRAQLVVRKGFRREIDSYSAFLENDRRTTTGLGGYLRERGVRRIFLAGLATDYCVLASALDARRLGLEVVVLEDACRGIGLDGSMEKAWGLMARAGVIRSSTAGLESPRPDPGP